MPHPETDAIRIQTERTQFREHSTPLYLTSSFIFEDAEQGRALFADEMEGNIYSRYSNPSTEELVQKVCALEKSEDGFAFASGMAAVFGTMAALLQSGDHVLSCRALFGATHLLFNKVFLKWGITHSYFNASEPDTWEALVTPKTKLIYIETPTNPGLEIVDLARIGDIAKKHRLILIVDNCFATPILQTPVDFGADLIVHSATKYFDGQGRVLGGIAVGRKDLIKEIRAFARQTGGALAPFNAWVLSKSLETLSIRMEKHGANALELTHRLITNPHISEARYPYHPSHPQYALARKQMKGGGGIVAIDVKGGLEPAKRFLDRLKMILISPNLGDTRTIVTHPASTTHSKLTDDERKLVQITPGMVRISVGLEHIDDITADIEQALQ